MPSKRILHLADRLRGLYILDVNDGAGLLNGEDTFTRDMTKEVGLQIEPIRKEAAARIEKLEEVLTLFSKMGSENIEGNEEYKKAYKQISEYVSTMAKAALVHDIPK